MAVCEIRNTEPKNINIPAAAAAGAGVGLGLRYFLPVQRTEVDTLLFNQSEEMKKIQIRSAKKTFLENIEKRFKQNPSDESMNLFLQRMKAATTEEIKATKDKIKNAPKEIQDGVSKLKSALADRIKASKNLTEANIKNLVKQSRSVWAFVLPGAALAAMGAYVYNVIGTITDD